MQRHAQNIFKIQTEPHRFASSVCLVSVCAFIYNTYYMYVIRCTQPRAVHICSVSARQAAREIARHIFSVYNRGVWPLRRLDTVQAATDPVHPFCVYVYLLSSASEVYQYFVVYVNVSSCPTATTMIRSEYSTRKICNCVTLHELKR